MAPSLPLLSCESSVSVKKTLIEEKKSGLARPRDKLKSLCLVVTVPMTTKFGRVVTYLKGLQTMKSNIAMLIWSCKVKRQTKAIISLQPECQ